MPDNNSLLQVLMERAQTPLVPQSAIQGAQDSLTTPHLNQSPMMARLKGFGAGALGGLREQTSPLNLAGIASLAAGPLGRLAGLGAKAAPIAAEAAEARTLGTMLPEFAPQGGEGSYNLNRFLDMTQQAPRTAPTPQQAALSRLLPNVSTQPLPQP